MRGFGPKLIAIASLTVLGCGPVEEAAPPATPTAAPVVVVQQPPPQVLTPQAQAAPAPVAQQLPPQDDLAPRPRLSRTVTLGQGNDQPVFEGPSRVQGPVAQSDPNSTTFRYSPYYGHTQTYYSGFAYGGYRGYSRGYTRGYGYYPAYPARVPAGPATTPPVGGDWPRAPIGGGVGGSVGGSHAPTPSPGFSGGGAGSGAGSTPSGGGILR